jgi:hypothetical protein
MNQNKLASAVLGAITAITAWFGLGLQQFILIDNTPGNGLTIFGAIGRFLIFFTVLSNILVAVSLTITLLSPASRWGHFFSRISSRTAIAVYIFIVGLVYNLVLRNTWHPAGWQKVADEILHVAVPLLYVLYWLLFVPKGTLKWKQCISWLIFPFIYVVYAMCRGWAEGFYAYPFLDLNVLSIGKVFINCIGLFLVFIVTGFVAIAIDRRMRPRW